jgi:nicotinate-nucleotide pyrophosphorylase
MNDVNDKNLIPSDQGEEATVLEKDAAVIKGAQEIVTVVRQMDYPLDILAVATALVKTHYCGIQINGSSPEEALPVPVG